MVMDFWKVILSSPQKAKVVVYRTLDRDRAITVQDEWCYNNALQYTEQAADTYTTGESNGNIYQCS